MKKTLSILLAAMVLVTIYAAALNALSGAAAIGRRTFPTLEEAFAAAKQGETVILQEDVQTEGLMLPAGILLDLNGRTLSAHYTVAFDGCDMYDSVGTGLLKCDSVRLEPNNSQMPVWDNAAGGYRFFSLKSQQTFHSQDASGFIYMAKPYLIGDKDNVLMAQSDTNGLHMKTRLRWVSPSGREVTQFFILDAKDTKVIYTTGSVIQLVISGVGAYKNSLHICCCIESETGVVWHSTEKLYTGETK